MNEDRMQMAEVLEGEHRLPTLQLVTNLVDPGVSSVLDVGCGTGALIHLLDQKIPRASIIGIDRSQYLLRVLKERQSDAKISLIQGEVPSFPFIESSFDLIIAVQSLHEICGVMGDHALETTIQCLQVLLKEGGSLIVLDHENPGYDLIRIRLPPHLFPILEAFKMKFRPREIVFNKIGHHEIEVSLRDFYDFVTKIWALDTPLEHEEMNETHTAFTREEFVGFVERVGLNVDYLGSATPIDNHLIRYGIKMHTPKNLPERHFILRAKKPP
ncbi:MAG: hypothetical protein C4K48_11380 [Candidatus Thorarchaeota archaeon]|nr:MAG: hypothetical protein C4K48_11380 [Candidatus Thorarchaeota archaeon]